MGSIFRRARIISWVVFLAVSWAVIGVVPPTSLDALALLHLVTPAPFMGQLYRASESCRRAGRRAVRGEERRDDLLVDLVADVGLALEGRHVLEARALGDDDRAIGHVGVLVADLLDEKQDEDVTARSETGSGSTVRRVWEGS